MAAYKLAIIGECMAELSGKPLGNMQLNYGGDTLNTALYLKQLLPKQVQVSFVTAMGKDSLSKAIVEAWHEQNIDTQLVLQDASRQVGVYMIELDAQGERSFQYWRNESAARYLMQHENILNVFDTLSHYQGVFLSGISLAILSDKDKQQLLSQLKTLSRLGVKIIFDGNYRPKLWKSMTQAKDFYTQIYKLSDLVLATFDDEQLLWQDRDLDACKQRLAQFDIAELVIKNGEHGCEYLSQQQSINVATQVVNHVVDTTAAGDSFNAGFLANWLQGKSAQECCELGNAVAGQVIQKSGAIVSLALSELIEL